MTFTITEMFESFAATRKEAYIRDTLKIIIQEAQSRYASGQYKRDASKMAILIDDLNSLLDNSDLVGLGKTYVFFVERYLELLLRHSVYLKDEKYAENQLKALVDKITLWHHLSGPKSKAAAIITAKMPQVIAASIQFKLTGIPSLVLENLSAYMTFMLREACLEELQMLIVEFSNLTEGISGDLSPNLTQIFEDFFTRYGSILQLFKPADDSVKILMHLRALAFSLVIFGIDKNLKVGVVWDLIKCEQDLLLKSANENHFYWFSDLEEYTKKSAIKSLELFPRIAAMWGELLPSGQSSKVESHDILLRICNTLSQVVNADVEIEPLTKVFEKLDMANDSYAHYFYFVNLLCLDHSRVMPFTLPHLPTANIKQNTNIIWEQYQSNSQNFYSLWESMMLQQWIFPKLGIVLGKDGRGGTGTCIRLEDGSLALLTARHVVLDCILTGAITIAHSDKTPTKSDVPKLIRVASRNDVAFLVFQSQDANADALGFAQWTTVPETLTVNLPVVASGAPGAWKQVDVNGKKIDSIKFLSLHTMISQTSGHIVCDIDETQKRLPASLQGMSGGPLFSLTKQFLGVIIGEARNKTPNQGELYVEPVEGLEELYKPFQPPADAPVDYIGQSAWSLDMDIENIGNPALCAKVRIAAELYWSESYPDAKYGRVGRISSFSLITDAVFPVYPINTESVFYWYEDTEEAKIKALHEEVRFLLDRTGWGIREHLSN